MSNRDPFLWDSFEKIDAITTKERKQSLWYAA